MSAIARHEVVALKLWQRQIDCVEQLSAEAVELRTQLAGKVADILRSCSTGAPIGDPGFLRANRKPDLQ